MYEQNYEDYIRNILGYQQPNIYNSYYENDMPRESSLNPYNNYPNYYDQTQNCNMCMQNYYDNNSRSGNLQRNTSSQLEEYYPEIYKVIYPMVSKACKETREVITKETLENMTDEIYNAFEGRNEIELNINLTNDVRTKPLNSAGDVKNNTTNSNGSVTARATSIIKNNDDKSKAGFITEKVKETRQFNGGIRDLIKILLLRELLNRPGMFPPPPPRPGPIPGPRPPMPPGRPPMNHPHFGPNPRPPFYREFEEKEMY